MTIRHALSFLVIAVAQFGILEAGLRTWGSSEAAPSFQGLFDTDATIGYRLKPHARTRFTTSEFAAEIAINGAGLRDDDEIGPKPAEERRIVLLGDSLVLSVQVPFAQTFGELLEERLNRRPSPFRYRVINAGVQGYGPIEEQLFFRSIAGTVQPDLVLPVVFVGNDAEEAVGSRHKLDDTRRTSAVVADSFMTRLRRLVRRSMVLQILRLRVVSVTDRLSPSLAPPEPPLQSYAAQPAPRIAEGLAITPRRDGRHRADRGDHRRGHGVRPDAGALPGRRRRLWPAAGCGVISRRDAGARRRQRALRSRPRAPGTAAARRAAGAAGGAAGA